MSKEFSILVDEFVLELSETLKKKNNDYGDSFQKQYIKYGMSSAMIRIEDKFNRLDNLVNNKYNPMINDESIDDTLLDLAGYAILTLIERHRRED